MIRTVELTNDSVVIDGRDVSDMVTGVDLHLEYADRPTVVLHTHPDAITYSGAAEVSGVPLDGIARLRRRLAPDG